jgi:predicted Zn-dependent protease
MLFLLLLAAAACQTNPDTGRRQLMLLSEDEEIQMGVQAFQQVQKESRFTEDPAFAEPVRRVGRAISEKANKPNYQWEFKVIDDDKTVNAWCLPGGKIAFYTGIYPILQDEAGMAIVMGHEVSHALLRHGGERVSQNILAQAGVTTVDLLAGGGGEWGQLTAAALGIGVLLPFSRKHETEADHFGLLLAAKAGYDPENGILIWERMSQVGGGSRPPEFLSTHPNPENRIENMRSWMPEAKALYERAAKQPNPKLPMPGKRR